MFGLRLQPAISAADLFPGSVFVYRGPRRFGVGPRAYSLAEVLAIDDAPGIVHVRVLGPAHDGGARPAVRVGHMPVYRRELSRDLVRIVGQRSPDVDCWETVNEFRRRYAMSEVGAMRGRLWHAERRARRVLARDEAELAIRFAFVSRLGGRGPLSVVEVLV